MSVVIPQRFYDCSNLREIPDNQEVFSDAITDQSIIIELLSLDSSIPTDQIAQYVGYRTD